MTMGIQQFQRKFNSVNNLFFGGFFGFFFTSGRTVTNAVVKQCLAQLGAVRVKNW